MTFKTGFERSASNLGSSSRCDVTFSHCTPVLRGMGSQSNLGAALGLAIPLDWPVRIGLAPVQKSQSTIPSLVRNQAWGKSASPKNYGPVLCQVIIRLCPAFSRACPTLVQTSVRWRAMCLRLNTQTHKHVKRHRTDVNPWIHSKPVLGKQNLLSISFAFVVQLYSGQNSGSVTNHFSNNIIAQYFGCWFWWKQFDNLQHETGFQRIVRSRFTETRF